MFSSLCEILLLKMGNIFHEISKKPSYVRTFVQRWVDGLVGLSYRGNRAYRVGGLVKNVMTLIVRTSWIIPNAN